MGETERTFSVASDQTLVELINRARKRLVVIAPALSKDVAAAVAKRLPDLGSLDITVILDADPEVYRLGFGDDTALEELRTAMVRSGEGLREQPGVRIGLVISDDAIMVYAPVSKNIEAGSTSIEKPNAILLGGALADRVATAAGQSSGENASPQEIGGRALVPAKVADMQANLKANPPKPFDIARKLNVFTSRVQYVEFKARNYQLTKRKIPLPMDLVDVASDDLRENIDAHIKIPMPKIGLDIVVKVGGKEETLKVSEKWLAEERKRIEDEYTFPLANFGRVILYSDKADFNGACARFKAIVEAYQTVLKTKIEESKTEFEAQILLEYAPRWKARLPKYFERWKVEPTEKAIESRLRELASEVFSQAIEFDPPEVSLLYKNVSFENMQDPKFLEGLRTIMNKRGVPRDIVESLFAFGAAAPEKDSLLAKTGG